MQAVPPDPHLPLLVPGLHITPSQQPLGQDVASQTHVPLTHRVPCWHASVVPQAHAPAAEQVSARVGSQATQVPPSMPHAARDAGRQVPLAQQPPGQD
jgi:hypothetical protein